jgi:hypothetical protein
VTAPPRALPPFKVLSSCDGALHVSWSPCALGDRSALIVALRPVDQGLSDAFWAGELDNDLIRQPVDAACGSATLYVPAGRSLHVALVVRGANGEVVASLPVNKATTSSEPARALEAPVPHDAAATQATPLVFAHGDTPPGFDALARRVAARASGGRPLEAESPPISGFGARQRWTLTRLRWPEGGGPLAIVIRDQFIDSATLDSWSEALPRDAMPIDDACDSLIDAEAPHGALRFYALMRGPAPWRPVALSPVPPPFDEATRPHTIGEIGARLAQGVASVVERLESAPLALSDLEPQLMMLEGAVDVLASGDPLRALVEQAVERWRPGGRT